MDSSPASELHICPLGDAPCKLSHELQSLRDEIDLLKEQVRTDALTGLYNFRFFSDTLPLEMERSRRSFQALSLIVLDIDHFKKFNDTWGHEIGNQVLVLVARQITLVVRKLDYACRFGGEEFVVLLPNTDLRQAKNVAERLREAIEGTPLVYDNQSLSVTASLGVDEFRGHHSDTHEGFIERVDAWLYQAKRDGRNCVRYPVVESPIITTTVTADEKDALFGGFDKKD
ncbi:GGDEF domain-containing protein [Cellvibrio mixtus]|uniref:GGDEF domain-containing protein n=1 Tax=Cellvibrio mixtus TaxID=39650 RepID=UPI000586B43C|nr:GGDEF domain-containing protein [Cellvibrio mixtus]